MKSSQPVIKLFFLLFKKSNYFTSCKINIPRTVVFEHDFPIELYHSIETKEFTMKRGLELESHKILSQFTSHLKKKFNSHPNSGLDEEDSNTIVGSYTRFNEKSKTTKMTTTKTETAKNRPLVDIGRSSTRTSAHSTTNNSGCTSFKMNTFSFGTPTSKKKKKRDTPQSRTTTTVSNTLISYSVNYFSPKNLDNFFLVEKNKGSGILQKFIFPKGAYNSILKTTWTRNFFKVDRITNIHKVRDESIDLFARCVTYEGFFHFSKPSAVSPLIKKRVRVLCNRIERHLFSVEKKSVNKMNLYFKIDKRDRMWLIFCDKLEFCKRKKNCTNLYGNLSSSSRGVVNRELYNELNNKKIEKKNNVKVVDKKLEKEETKYEVLKNIQKKSQFICPVCEVTKDRKEMCVLPTRRFRAKLLKIKRKKLRKKRKKEEAKKEEKRVEKIIKERKRLDSITTSNQRIIPKVCKLRRTDTSPIFSGRNFRKDVLMKNKKINSKFIKKIKPEMHGKHAHVPYNGAYLINKDLREEIVDNLDELLYKMWCFEREQKDENIEFMGFKHLDKKKIIEFNLKIPNNVPYKYRNEFMERIKKLGIKFDFKNNCFSLDLRKSTYFRIFEMEISVMKKAFEFEPVFVNSSTKEKYKLDSSKYGEKKNLLFEINGKTIEICENCFLSFSKTRKKKKTEKRNKNLFKFLLNEKMRKQKERPKSALSGRIPLILNRKRPQTSRKTERRNPINSFQLPSSSRPKTSYGCRSKGTMRSLNDCFRSATCSWELTRDYNIRQKLKAIQKNSKIKKE